MLKMTIEETQPGDVEDALQGTSVDLTLIDENNRPTKTLVGLMCLELACDFCVALIAYKALKHFRG